MKKMQKTVAHKPFCGGLQGVLGDKLLRELLLACALTVATQPKFLHLLCSSWGLATKIAKVGKA